MLTIPAVRSFAEGKLAKLQLPPSQQKISWARAHVKWADGMERTGWLRAGDGYAFLAKAAAGAAQRLIDGRGVPGCFTPGSLFEAGLAEEAGGEFIVETAGPIW